MSNGYTRQSSANLVAGLPIQVADVNAEFNKLEQAFNDTTGHDHTGGTGLGPKLSLTAAVTGLLPLANGGLNADLSATGGTSRVLKQISTGAAITVGQLATTDLSNVVATTTFSPVLQFGGATTSIAYSLQSGAYSKVGNLIVARIRITLTNKGSATGVATITGLPVAAASTAVVTCGYYTGMSSMTNLMGYMNGSATINLTMSGTTDIAALTDANFTNASDIILGVSYLA